MEKIIANRLTYFQKTDNILESYRSGNIGFLHFKKNIILPCLLKTGFIIDKKNKTILIGNNRLTLPIFNFLFGKIFFEGNNSKIEELICHNGELINATLRNIIFNKNIELVNNNFVDVKFINCRFIDCNFIGSIFKNCFFKNCFFYNCNMEKTYWSGSNEEILAGEYYPNKVSNCFFENISYSSSQGIGATIFFSEKTNKILENEEKTLYWHGETMYYTYEKLLMIDNK